MNIIQEKDIVASRSCGRKIAADLGFGSVEQARIAAAISELARNIYKYTEGGTIEITAIRELKRVGIFIVATDHGPGILNLHDAMSVGFTTSNSLGRGLPGVKRMMDNFDITSSSETGTCVKIAKYKLIAKRSAFF